MADDQATLGSFADPDGTDPDAAGDADPDGTAGETSDADDRHGAALPADDGDRVCPWCLAGADQFIETGPTGLACGRCSGALPVGADWFEARHPVARRPMYGTDE